MRHQEIIFGLPGQRFTYWPPEGRPTSASASVHLSTVDDDGEAQAATSGPCVIDAVDTVLLADAPAGETTLVVDVAGHERGQRYQLVAPDGGGELVELVTIAGGTLGLRRPLSNSYPAGSSLRGTRISVDVDPGWASDLQHISDARGDCGGDMAPGQAGYRVRWLYVVDGRPALGVSFADLVRYPAKNMITALDVEGRFPGWIDRLPPDFQRDQGAALVEEAFAAVRLDLLGDAQMARRVRDTEVLGELTIYKASVQAAIHNVLAGRADQGAVAIAERLYAQRYQQLVRAAMVAVDTAGGGAAAPAPRMPAWRR